MQKYKVFEKLKKTRHCSYYNAENLVTHEIVTIKKLSKNNDWEQLLHKREVTLMKQPNLPFLAKIKQIIKENGKFFVVHEQLTQCVQDLRKKDLDLEVIANIGRQVLEIVYNLSKEGVILVELRPEFFFISRKIVKIAHIVSLPGESQKGQLQQSPDYKYFSPEATLGNKQINPDQANIFTIGLIICQLLLGKPLIPAKNKLDYIYILCSLFPKQKLEQSSLIRNSNPSNDTSQTFEEIMTSVCSSKELIELLSEMTKVNPKHRITLTDAIKRMKQQQIQFGGQQQQQISPKKRIGNSVDTKRIMATMSKASKDIKDERYRLAQNSSQKKQQQQPKQKEKIINTNHQIQILVESEIPEKLGFMPPLSKENQPLKSQKNVNDDATRSTIIHKKKYSELTPESNTDSSPLILPVLKQQYSPSHPKQEKEDKSPKKMSSKTMAYHRNPHRQIRIKTEPTIIQNLIRCQNLTATLKQKSKGPQLTNYAFRNFKNFGVQIAPDEPYSQSDRD